jgi:hypothetical protein
MSAPLSTTVPIVSATSVPASVRDGSPAARKAYETALDFEQMLVGQLSKGLIESSGLSGAGEGEGAGEASGEAGASGQAGSAGTGLLSALAPQALTEGIVREGGLGLAGQLMGALDPAAATEGPRASAVVAAGGTAPGAASPSSSSSVAGAQTAPATGPTGGVSA